MKTADAFAPAKINLTLHVTGRRADGYHLLDSLVCFADIGDRVWVRQSAVTRLTVTGPFAKDVPTGPENLVCRAAAVLGVAAEIELEKTLPVASGLGGGSSDAAAAIKALTGLFRVAVPDRATLLGLGADVPVCMLGGMVRMQGIGEVLTPLKNARMPWPTVLANPGVAVSTPEVFARLERRDNPPMEELFVDAKAREFPDWVSAQRNDLEAPALALAPVIGDVLDALRAEPGCRVARMSGSGATCFALYDDAGQAAEAAERIGRAKPGWWVKVAIS